MRRRNCSIKYAWSKDEFRGKANINRYCLSAWFIPLQPSPKIIRKEGHPSVCPSDKCACKVLYHFFLKKKRACARNRFGIRAAGHVANFLAAPYLQLFESQKAFQHIIPYISFRICLRIQISNNNSVSLWIDGFMVARGHPTYDMAILLDFYCVANGMCELVLN